MRSPDLDAVTRPVRVPASDPILSQFGRLGLGAELQEAVSRLGFSTPTEVQSLGIPQIMKDQHVMLAAETGTRHRHVYHDR